MRKVWSEVLISSYLFLSVLIGLDAASSRMNLVWGNLEEVLLGIKEIFAFCEQRGHSWREEATARDPKLRMETYEYWAGNGAAGRVGVGMPRRAVGPY